MQFREMNLIPEILRAVEEMEYTEATDIQVGAIPVLLEGRDLIGRSNTGTGKTAAFGIPVVQIVANSSQKKGQILILSPTRELAMQTGTEVRKFSKYLQNIKVAVVCGGESMPLQIRQLRTAQIVVGTPGRIMDHLRRRTLSLENLKTVVLDEADEMLNMGFVEDIQTILTQTPENRQTVLFSATMPPAILKITKEFQTDPKMIAVDKGSKTVDNITQYYCNVPRNEKTGALELLLEYHHPKQALIFCNTKKTVNELCRQLVENGFQAAGIHGDLRQNQRNQVMSDFKSGRTGILVATDVAARGIDVENVDAVFNYDIPDEDEYYIHRIGRTGRAGKAGASFTLAAGRSQLRRVHALEHFMGVQIQEKPLPDLDEIKGKNLNQFKEQIRRLLAETSAPEWASFADELERDGLDLKEVSASLCKLIYEKSGSFRALKNVHAGEPESSGPECSRLSINIGTDCKINSDFIIGAIIEATGLPVGAVKKVELYREHSVVEMTKSNADLVAKKMDGFRIKQHTVHVTILHGKRTVPPSKNRDSRYAYNPKRHFNNKKHGGTGSAASRGTK